MTRYLGIDPGLSGALAIVETINGVPALVDAIDMPSTGTGAKARVDVIAAAEWIAKHAPSTAYVERTQAYPGKARQAGFPTAGRSAPSRRDRVCPIPMTLVEPSTGSAASSPRQGQRSGPAAGAAAVPLATRAAREEERPRTRRSRTDRGRQSGARAMKHLSRDQEKELADHARLMRAWKAWHREQLDRSARRPARADAGASRLHPQDARARLRPVVAGIHPRGRLVIGRLPDPPGRVARSQRRDHQTSRKIWPGPIRRRIAR